jgi:hypothetical protein
LDCERPATRTRRKISCDPQGEIPLCTDEIAPTLKKNETVQQAVERLRRKLRELQADTRRVAAAPIHSSRAREIVRAQVEALATRGQPDVELTIESASPMAWPMEFVSLQLHGMTNVGNPVAGSAGGSLPNAMAYFTWILKDEILKRLDQEIDELSDDDSSLTDIQRAEQLNEIAQDRLVLEREECALIERAEEQGHTIVRRSDCDPRALLSLSSDLPGPTEN